MLYTGHRDKGLAELLRVIDCMSVVTGSLEGELPGKLLAIQVKRRHDADWKGPGAVSALSSCSSHSEVTLESFPFNFQISLGTKVVQTL